MSRKQTSVVVKTQGPDYLDWRGELLGELALVRHPDLAIHKRTSGPPPELPYDFLVTTTDGLCFYVEIKAFSSMRLGIEDQESIPELLWSVDADLVRRARESRNPVVLFLFDADGEHGRYLRLDTLPAPAPNARQVMLRFPVERTISSESLERLVAELQAVPTS
jgi:hypothetical protein